MYLINCILPKDFESYISAAESVGLAAVNSTQLQPKNPNFDKYRVSFLLKKSKGRM